MRRWLHACCCHWEVPKADAWHVSWHLVAGVAYICLECDQCLSKASLLSFITPSDLYRIKMPIDHASFSVPKQDYQSIVAWYLAALAPLGYEKLMEPVEGIIGFGANKDPDVSIENERSGCRHILSR